MTGNCSEEINHKIVFFLENCHCDPEQDGKGFIASLLVFVRKLRLELTWSRRAARVPGSAPTLPVTPHHNVQTVTQQMLLDRTFWF